MAISIDEAVPGPATDDAPPERRRGGRGRMVVEVLLLTALAVAMLFPVLWMLETSIKENRDVYAVPAKFFGFDITLDHYKDVFVARGGGRSDLSGSFLNSVDRGRRVDRAGHRAGSPGGVGLLALHPEGQEGPAVLHPVDPLHAARGRGDPDLPDVPRARAHRQQARPVLIYAAFNVPFTIWMMKGFVDEVPAEYEDAAMLDGYTRLQAFWRVTLPLLVPGIAATAVFALIFSWNEFVFAIFLTSSQEVRTAPPAIAGLIGGTTVDWGLVAASAVVFALPVLVFAYLVRKHLVAGVTLGAVRR